jgi:hypothetical protein
MILFFKSDTCRPCRMMFSFVKDLPGVQIVNTSDENNHGMINEYGIHSVPTTIRIENGVEVHRRTGLMNKKEFLAFSN